MKKNKGGKQFIFLLHRLFLISIWKYWKESTGNTGRKETIRDMGSEEVKHLKCFTPNTASCC